MERIVNLTTSFKAADQWDVRQNANISRDERLRIAEQLKHRVYGGANCPDVRESGQWHRTKR